RRERIVGKGLHGYRVKVGRAEDVARYGRADHNRLAGKAAGRAGKGCLRPGIKDLPRVIGEIGRSTGATELSRWSRQRSAEIAPQLCGRGDEEGRCAALDLPQAFVVHKEEGLVLADRTAK